MNQFSQPNNGSNPKIAKIAAAMLNPQPTPPKDYLHPGRYSASVAAPFLFGVLTVNHPNRATNHLIRRLTLIGFSRTTLQLYIGYIGGKCLDTHVYRLGTHRVEP